MDAPHLFASSLLLLLLLISLQSTCSALEKKPVLLSPSSFNSKNIISIFAGAFHSMAIADDGTVFSWGANNYGQLGTGSIVSSSSPTTISRSFFGGHNISQISAGMTFSVALTTDGFAYAWGTEPFQGDGPVIIKAVRKTPQQLEQSSFQNKNVSIIAAGAYHSVAVTSDSKLFAWGSNTNGQIGDGSSTARYNPVQITSVFFEANMNVSAVSAGFYNTMIVSSSGRAYAWGRDHADTTTQSSSISKKPVQLSKERFNSKNISMVSAGSYHSMALAVDGAVFAWGDNSNYQIGDGTAAAKTTPVLLGSDAFANKNISLISAGSYSSLALTDDGIVFNWGKKHIPPLSETTVIRKRPVQLNSAYFNYQPVKSLSAGTYHSMAYASDGELYLWGANSDYQIGDGTTISRTTPIPVAHDLFDSKNLTQLSAGYYKSMVLDSTGKGYAWGKAHIPLDNPYAFIRKKPIQFSQYAFNNQEVAAVAAGAFHSLALTGDGTVYSWGPNNRGQLGDGTTTFRQIPGVVSRSYLNNKNMTAIAAGSYFSLASGVCTSPENCTCATGYTGLYCRYPICAGIVANETNVCNGRGICLKPDTCTNCATGWVGSNCQIPVCYGKNATDSTVCNSYGSCVAPNTCSCFHIPVETIYGFKDPVVDTTCALLYHVYYISKSINAPDSVYLNDSARYFLIQSITIQSGASLVIPPGTTVHLNNTSIDVYGTLQAIGNATHYITFTNATANEGWNSINLRNTSSSSVLQKVTFERGGRNNAKAVIVNQSRSTVIHQVEFRECSYSWGIHACAGGTLWSAGEIISLQNSPNSPIVYTVKC